MVQHFLEGLEWSAMRQKAWKSLACQAPKGPEAVVGHNPKDVVVGHTPIFFLRTRVAALTNHLTPYADLHGKRRPPENTKRGGTTFTYPTVQWDRQHGSSQIAFCKSRFFKVLSLRHSVLQEEPRPFSRPLETCLQSLNMELAQGLSET
jgi:hypothetical protein